MEDLPSESTVVRPFSLQQGPNSAFRPWKPSNCKKDLGIAETSSNSTTEPSLQLQLAISNSNNNAAQDNNDMHVENSTPENPFIDGGGATSGVRNHAQAAQRDEIQDMDPKLKRYLSIYLSIYACFDPSNPYLICSTWLSNFYLCQVIPLCWHTLILLPFPSVSIQHRRNFHQFLFQFPTRSTIFPDKGVGPTILFIVDPPIIVIV